MDPEDQTQSLLAPTPEYLASVQVFPLIPYLKRDVIKTIDSALSWEQLTASDINFSIVRPLVFKYARLKNMAVVYACLVVRSYFLAESETDLAYSGVMLSRATLCEILAIKLLSRFASNHIQLVAVLTTSWNPLAGATSDIIEEVKHALGGDDDDMNYPQSAIEIAISTQAKAFLSSPVSQKVVNGIYTGRVVFSTTANRSMLADNYKPRAIEIYDCATAPFLDHYRLRVPKYNAILEFMNFSVLLLAFVLCLANQDAEKERMTPWEIVFITLAVSFTLGEYTASKEHGWIIYIANMWNVFDSSFIAIFLAYLVLRIQGIVKNDVDSSAMAFEILACGACILFPRLAFFAVSNNVVILSLRAMIAEFVFFIGIAAICFSGLLFTLWTLGMKDLNFKQPRLRLADRHATAKDTDRHEIAEDTWTVKAIAWLMVQIWFGNTYLSFGQASSFHPLFGPILMTGFAALSNTLLLTILISILSNTVARIDANANQEYLFQFTIATIEGVKSDALFSYQPPFNLLALIVLKPASWFLSPRALHSANVFLIKLTSFPILIVIGIYERHFAAGRKLRQSSKDAAHSLFNSLPRHIKNLPILDALVGSTSSDLYDAIFDVELPDEFNLFDESDDDFPALRSLASRDNIRPGHGLSPTPRVRHRPPSLPRSPRREQPSPLNSPRLRLSSTLSADVPSVGGQSPLAKLFGQRTPADHPAVASAEASVRRVETLLDDIRDLPLRRLTDEMKELQDRQSRIENLLLVLTRGMRNDTHRSETLP